MKMRRKNKEQIAGIKKSCELSKQTLDYIQEFVVEGVSTEELDNKINDFIISNNATSACLGYRDYPKFSCISINDVVCHGVPNPNVILQDGDMLNIDVSTILNGYYGDTSRMYTVGNVSLEAKNLIDITYKCLMQSIESIYPNMALTEIGLAIVDYIRDKPYELIGEYCGHGVGLEFHEEPYVLHYPHPKFRDCLLEPGSIFTIEPIITLNQYSLITENDNWTVRAVDKNKNTIISAQWEHTVLITENGYEVLT